MRSASHNPESISPARKLTLQSKMDIVFRVAMAGCALLIVILIAGIFFELTKQSLPSIKKFGLGFFISSAWNPVTGEYGAWTSIYGTLVSTFVAMVIAVPISIGVALFLVELAPPVISQIIGRAIELLAAIPSIIYGMWGLFVFVPFMGETVQPFLAEHELGVDFILLWLLAACVLWALRRFLPYLLSRYAGINADGLGKPLKIGSVIILLALGLALVALTFFWGEAFADDVFLFQGPPIGIGLLTTGMVLALMILPYIASVTRDVFQMVPGVVKESAYGVGSTTWEVTSKVTVPYGMAGILGACFLGLGRALGETMAVTFVIGNSFQIPSSIFDPSITIASTLATQFGEAAGNPERVSVLMELGLILCVISFAVQIVSQYWLKRAKKRMGRGL